jgi:hypothetical protein
MLPPTRARFHLLIRPGSAAAGRQARAAGHALVRLPVTALAAPFGVLGQAARAAGAAVRLIRHALLDTADFGARDSIREIASVDVPKIVENDVTGYALDSYVQAHDSAKYAKILERQLIAAVLDFLQDREVDTSEYRQRATTILNYGVLQFGGRMDIRDSKLGTG